MNFSSIKVFFKRGGHFLSKHSPTILTVMGTGGVVTSVVFAVKATPKAQILIQKKKAELAKKKLTPLETAQACWKVYIPTAGMMVTTIGCVVGANCINLKRNAALASLLAASRHEFGELHQKMVETIGEEKTQEIHEQVQKKLAAESSEKPDKDTAKKHKCIDQMTGQIFYATKEQLRYLNLLIRDMIYREGSMTKNDVLELNGERPVSDGDSWGWNDQTGFELVWKSGDDENGEPCFLVDYLVPPVERFNYIY